MIKIDATVAVAAYLIFSLSLVFISWLFYNVHQDHKIFHQKQHINQCPYCTGVFSVSESKDIVVCPHCKAYVTVNNNQTKRTRNHAENI